MFYNLVRTTRFWNDLHRVRNDLHRVRNDLHRVQNDLHRVRNDLHRVRNILKPNYFKIFRSKKTKGHKQNIQNHTM